MNPKHWIINFVTSLQYTQSHKHSTARHELILGEHHRAHSSTIHRIKAVAILTVVIEIPARNEAFKPLPKTITVIHLCNLRCSPSFCCVGPARSDLYVINTTLKLTFFFHCFWNYLLITLLRVVGSVQYRPFKPHSSRARSSLA